MEYVSEKTLPSFLEGKKLIARYMDGVWHTYMFLCYYPNFKEYIIALDLFTKEHVRIHVQCIIDSTQYYINYTRKELYEYQIRLYESRIERLRDSIKTLPKEEQDNGKNTSSNPKSSRPRSRKTNTKRS